MRRILRKGRTQARMMGSRFVGFLVDRAGGWPEELPDGSRTRVAFQSRGFARNYEEPVVRSYVAALQPGMLVLDVGAHWGLYSLLASRKASRVVAFEPILANRVLLARNMFLAGAQSVDVRAEAVTDVDGEITFHAYEGRTWGMSMMSGVTRQSFTRSTTVPSVRLDTLRLDPDVIKLDVEGAEVAALDGALDTIRRARPTLFVEVHANRMLALGVTVESLSARLTEWSYEYQILMSSRAGGESISHWMCTPAERRPRSTPPMV